MGKGFSKFKRKLRLGAIVRAVVFGLSLGAVTFAVLWTLAKLNAQEPDLTVAILYAAAAAGGAVLGLTVTAILVIFALALAVLSAILHFMTVNKLEKKLNLA